MLVHGGGQPISGLSNANGSNRAFKVKSHELFFTYFNYFFIIHEVYDHDLKNNSFGFPTFLINYIGMLKFLKLDFTTFMFVLYCSSFILSQMSFSWLFALVSCLEVLVPFDFS